MIPNFITSPSPDTYLTDDYVVLDVETTNHDKGSALHEDNRLLLSVWGKGAYKKQWGGIYDVQELIADIEAAKVLVCHNAKFELQWLKLAGLDLTKVLVYDTLLGEYVIAGNRRIPLDLGSTAKRYGYGEKDPYVDICMKGGVCPSELPSSKLEQRCVKDVRQTELIFLAQRKKLLEEKMLGVLYTRCIFTPVLADIEFNGIFLDRERVENTYNDYYKQMADVEQRLSAFTGGINPNSPKQKAEFLYDVLKFKELKRYGKVRRTPKGGRLTGSDDILALKATTKKQKQYVALQREYNKLNAALTKNLEFFYGVCKEKGSTFKGAFNQSTARTHRLTSSGRKIDFSLYKKAKSCQFQNLPRQFKGLFRARKEGWNIAEIDGAQLEFRVAGYIGNDKQVRDDVVNDVDIHQFTADTLTAAGQETDRQGAKEHSFKPLYGGSSGTTAEQTYYQAFKDKYTGVTNYQGDSIDYVLNHKYLRIASGLKFYWPNTKMSNSGYVENTTAICNYPVQSLATAEIIPIAVTMLWHEMKDREMESFLVNTVHDSAIAELHPEENELFSEVAVKSFTEYVYFYLKEVYNIEFNIPLGAGVKIGSHWSEGEEVKYESVPPYSMAA